MFEGRFEWRLNEIFEVRQCFSPISSGDQNDIVNESLTVFARISQTDMVWFLYMSNVGWPPMLWQLITIHLVIWSVVLQRETRADKYDISVKLLQKDNIFVVMPCLMRSLWLPVTITMLLGITNTLVCCLQYQVVVRCFGKQFFLSKLNDIYLLQVSLTQMTP